MNKTEMMNYIKKTSFIPSKKMGQNFLFSNEFQNKIVNSLNDTNNVLEIGPGLGALTDILVKKIKNLKLIELDKRIVDFIKSKHKGIEIINNNFLNIDLDKIYDENFSVISNLPYSISSSAIVKLIKCEKVNESIILIQKEVADRLVAKFGDDKYNGFSIFVQTFSNVEKLFDIPKTVFYPEPEVTSTLVRITNKKNINIDINKYEKFIRSCFQQKRKTIFNNLKNTYDKNKINYALDELSIPSTTRPEDISNDEFVLLFEKLNEKN